MKTLLVAVVWALFAIQCVLAQEVDSQPKSPEAAANAEATVLSTKRYAPKLNVVWNCSNCERNEKVAPLIEDAYRVAVAKDGRLISDTETAELVIYQFHQRNVGLRIMFGAMGGKDRLGVRMSYKGKELTASDYSANAVQGMNHLCESVATKMYQNIATLLE